MRYELLVPYKGNLDLYVVVDTGNTNEGESNLLDTMQIQQQAIAAQSNLLAIRRSQLEQCINLYLSLGGSW